MEHPSTHAAPQAIGPYSSFVRAGDFVFVSGQIPLDAASGELVPGDIRAQTMQAMRNLDAVLRAAGASLTNVTRTTIYLADMNDFGVVNAAYGGFFHPPYPARATVAVAGLPRGARIEIDAVAYVGTPARLRSTCRTMAKRPSVSESISFDDAALSADATNALAIVSAIGADEQADLVEAWVARGNVAAVAALAREDDAPSPARKAARRGLHVMKARGTTVPETSLIARPLAGNAESTQLEARFSPPDGTGAAVFLILSKTPGRDARIVDIVVSEAAGILRVTGGTVSQSRLREWEADMRRSFGFAPVRVPVAWARARVAAARARNAQSGTLLPLELDAYSDLTSPAAEAAPTHPAEALDIAMSDANRDEVIARSNALHREPELSSYLPTNEAVREAVLRVGQRLSEKGEGELTDEVFRAILDEEMAAATDRFFTQEAREQLAARMLDAVVSIHTRAGADRARDVMIVREAVQKAGLITGAPREIPFLRAFFDKALALVAQQSGGQLNIPVPARAAAQESDGGLVLSPGQIAAVEAAKAGEKVTEGGIILP